MFSKEALDVPVLPVGLELVVPDPLIITFELAFLITLLTVFDVVELLVAHIDLVELKENVSSKYLLIHSGWQQTPLSRLCKRKE